MNIFKSMQDTVQYLIEAALRLFSPSDDQYPNVGVHPYEGDVPSK